MLGMHLKSGKKESKVSVDLQADNTESQGEIEDANEDEYGFVSEYEKGTAQALGPATSEQVDKNVNEKCRIQIHIHLDRKTHV